jgi:hypothetical protein
MEPRIDVMTLAVSDLKRALDFPAPEGRDLEQRQLHGPGFRPAVGRAIERYRREHS